MKTDCSCGIKITSPVVMSNGQVFCIYCGKEINDKKCKEYLSLSVNL